MEWQQVLFLFFANAALMTWFRAESRADWRHMDNKLHTFMKGIQEEMRDFHNRLIEVEKEKK